MATRPVQRLAAWLRPAADENRLVDDAPPMTIVEVLRRFWPDLRPLVGWLVLLLLLLGLLPVISVLEILLFERLVDDVLVPADPGPLLFIAALYVGLNLLAAVVAGADDLLSTWVSQKFLVRLRTRVFAHVLALPGAVTDRRRLGDTMSRITSDVSAVESFMIRQLTAGAGAVARLVVYAGALVWLQWQLALVSLVAVPILYGVATRFARLVKNVSRERRRRAGSLSAVTEESLANAALMQAYGRDEEAVRDYHRQNRAIAHAEIVGARIRAVFLPLADLAELVATLAVIGAGTWALATDRLSLGGLLAFLALLVQCYRPLRELADLLPSLFSATAGVERIVELLDVEPPADRPGAVDLTDVSGRVRVDGVRLRYPGATSDAVRDVDLVAEPGELVVLAGPSGAGKSTVVRLLTREIEPDDGVVRLDGHDLRDVTRTSLRQAVTVVPQETALLDATIAENIAFGRPGAARVDVEAAGRAAGVADFVDRLPEGWDTRVGQRGRSLSGGQRQRVAVARALLRASPVVVLDEPTTGLGADDARALVATLRGERGRRTVVVASHDPVVIDAADRVVLVGAAVPS